MVPLGEQWIWDWLGPALHLLPWRSQKGDGWKLWLHIPQRMPEYSSLMVSMNVFMALADLR
jgi:hypothetical protein